MRTIGRNSHFVFGLLLFFSVLSVLSVAHDALAQFGGGEQPMKLTLSPEFPAPEADVTVSLDAYAMDTTGASIVWFVDGKEHTDARNARSLTLTTGALGTSQGVSIQITKQNSAPLTLSRKVTPSRLDIITEAQTYVPVFYKGRALPVEELPVRFIALPHTSLPLSPAQYTYRWELDGSVLFGGPVKGKYAIDITMPRYANHILMVTAIDAEGHTVGVARETLKAATPELYFYEESLLRGLSPKALDERFTLTGDETTIHGEPYFIATHIGEGDASFSWKINGAPAESTGDPHTLTLRKTGGAGNATIELEASTAGTVPSFLKKAFTIFF